MNRLPVLAGVLALAGASLAGPTTPAHAAAGGGPGCTAPGAPGEPQSGDTSQVREIGPEGESRRVVMRLPRGYESRDDWPVVVAFHGRGSTGAEVEGYSELSRLPAVVAYPDGEVGTGEGHRRAWQGAPYAAPEVDDVAFTETLLDTLADWYCTDESRVYATGKSNGAGLVALLACRMPDRIAAFAPVAGAYYPPTQEECPAGEAAGVPLLSVHGTGDSTIPYDGDVDRGLPPVVAWTTRWARRAGCVSTPVQRRTAADVTTLRWRGCDDGLDVRHVAVDDGGHVWPGADVYSGGGHVTHSIETSRLVWRFFTRHSLPDHQAPRATTTPEATR